MVPPYALRLTPFTILSHSSPSSRLLEKATALKNERESQRLKYVENAYEERWREECDDVRDLDGKALSVFMAAEREKQVKEKELRDREHAQKENDFLTAWEKQLAKMAALDDEKIANAKSKNLSTFEGLKQQIAERDAAKQQHYDNMMKEAEDEIAEVKAAIGTEEARGRQRKLDEIARGKEVLAFNAKYKDIAAEKAAIEAEHDKQLLEHALMEERARIKEEQDKQKAGADAAKQYRKYLEEMMVKEAEDNGFVDEINKREEEKIWKARDDALQARQDARDYLMKLVQEGREEQIAYKAKVAAAEKEEGKLFAKKFMSEIAEGVAKDREAAEARRAKNVANLHSLREQMAERKQLAELEEQDKYLDNKRMQYIEKQHQEKLSRQGGVVRTFHPKRKSDV